MQTAPQNSFGKTITWSILTIFLTITQAAHGQAVKIMPLGDSLTSGYQQYVSYRYDLWFDLVDAGFDFDFVGGNITTDGIPNLDWYPNYLTSFDRHHEGYSGYRADELASFARALAMSHRPDIVLLWAGINDLWYLGSSGVLNAKFGLRDTIENIRSVLPGVTILLGLVPPYDNRNGEFVASLNAEIVALAADLDSPQSPVILVDHHTGYNIGSMTWDNVHQNRAGEEWVANKWFGVLASIIPETASFQINAGLNDAWFNPLTNGQGFFVNVFPVVGQVFVGWFTYDTERPPEDVEAILGESGHRWLSAQGPFHGDTAILDVYLSSGGVFDSEEPAVGTPEKIGTMEVTWTGCNAGAVTYDLPSLGLSGTIPIQRIVLDNIALCEVLAED
jgi:lysophospholipase L1-like esterase